jgi:hypothetical protein
MAMPLPAIAILIEFTGIEHDFLVPLFLAVIGSVAISKACAVLGAQTAPAPADPIVALFPRQPPLFQHPALRNGDESLKAFPSKATAAQTL